MLALALVLLAQAPELDPDAAASWLLTPCGKVVVAADGDPELAKAVRVALSQSGQCERVVPSSDAWPEGWTLEQEQLVRTQAGADSQLVVARPGQLSYVDGHGAVFAEVEVEPGKPLLRSPRAPPPARTPFTRFEGMVSPAGIHMNPGINRHLLLSVGATYRLWSFLGIGARFLGTYWFSAEGPVKTQIEVERTEPGPHAFLKLDWAAMFALESVPLTFPISPFVEVAFGFGASSHVLNPGINQPASLGATGLRPVGSGAIGVRWQPVKWLTLRAAVRDIITPGGASTVNGCNDMDLRAIDQALRAGQSPTVALVAPGCNVAAFQRNGRYDDVPLAYSFVRSPSDALTHLVTIDLAVGVAF